MRALTPLVLGLLIAGCDNGTDTPDPSPTPTATAVETDMPATGDVVVLVNGTFDVLLGEQVTLTATTVNGTDMSYTWASDDEDVAIVDENGEVTALSTGSATITATGADTMESGSLGIVVSIDSPYREAWASSGHADVTAEAFNHWDEDGEVSASCARCHTTTGLQDYFGADGSTVDQVDTAHEIGQVIQCTACHNPEADSRDYVTFPSGETVEDLGGEARCMTCHQGRSSTDSVDTMIDGAMVGDDTPSTDLSFQNIHYYAAGATLLAGQVRGGYQYQGMVYDYRFRHAPGMTQCNDCHDQHSLEIQFDRCDDCHAGVNDIASARNIRMLPSRAQDYNGNGNVLEGIYYEISGLRDKVYAALQAYPDEYMDVSDICYDAHAYPYWFIDTNGSGGVCEAGEAIYPNAYNTWTPRMVRAAYNYQVALKDPGAWAHNGKYIIKLLFDSVTDLNTVLTTPVDMSNAVRNDQGHFNGASEAAQHWNGNAPVQASCSKCHGASEGFRFYNQYGVSSQDVVGPDNGLDCYTCHEDFQNFNVLDVDDTTFPNGVVIDMEDVTGDHSNLCSTCHSGRESAASVDAAIASGSPGFKNIHYRPAAVTRQGADAGVGYQYSGKSYDGAWYSHPGGDGCVDCHVVTSTNHSHNVVDNFAQCQICHTSASTAEDIKAGSRNGVDYDGDGNSNEPLADEVAGMADKLLATMQSRSITDGHPICMDSHSYPYFFNSAITAPGPCLSGEATRSNSYSHWTDALSKAAFNLQYAHVEPGAWAHNFDYIGQLLYDSIEDLDAAAVTPMTRPTAPAAP